MPIERLVVDGKVYAGDTVKDGFFDSVSKLKMKDSDEISQSVYIPHLCSKGEPVPPIIEFEAFEILERLKPDVDVDSITPNNYLFQVQLVLSISI